MYTPDPVQRPVGPPASGTPARDYLNTRPPGVDQTYAVLPRNLVESMPLAWQQQMTHLLAEFHRTYAHLGWPVYRVVPSRVERLVDLDEDQLAEVGVIMEIDGDGDLVYRDRAGKRIENPDGQTALVSVLDPIPAAYANATQRTPPNGFPQPQFPPSGPLQVQAPPSWPA
ncbi:hypothetical protein GCM10022243_40000 [Saccharothrix violaceirubra]|uniref:Uncharacterized protein n=1 Tax=Saccharothrix violaceirubra TaxID=413306 RepID=A0A7W7T820_9PSEU|nr:hypothetical protein [Saccharothrix violaceirubra]MBB4968256.1 hypothetical protein [Saccharothrix violaceirubra]